MWTLVYAAYSVFVGARDLIANILHPLFAGWIMFEINSSTQFTNRFPLNMHLKNTQNPLFFHIFLINFKRKLLNAKTSHKSSYFANSFCVCICFLLPDVLKFFWLIRLQNLLIKLKFSSQNRWCLFLNDLWIATFFAKS